MILIWGHSMPFQDLKLSKYNFYFAIGFLVILEILVAVFVLPGQYKQIGQEQAQLDQVNTDINNLNQSLSSLSQIDAKTLNNYFDKASAALPDEKKTSGLITGLSKLASASGMVMESLEFTPGLISTESGLPAPPPVPAVIQGGGIQSTTAFMVVSGDLPSLTTFLRNLHKASQLLGIYGVKYRVLSAAGLQTEVDIYVYYQPAQNIEELWKHSVALSDTDKEVLSKLAGKDIFNLQSE